MPDLIGWVATAIFGISYFVRRLVQASAALCWMVCGILLHAALVIVANIIAATLAVFSAWHISQSSNPAPSEALTT